jgi:formyltetrahydrofolate deformylase
MSYRKALKKVAQIRVAGIDKKGIIAAVTGYLSQCNCNIEDIDQRILEGYLIMNMQVDYSDLSLGLKPFVQGLERTALKLGMEASFKEESKKLKKVALLVTKESHCLDDLLKNFKSGQLKGTPAVIIGNQDDLKKIAQKAKIPFHFVPSEKKKLHENEVLEILKENDIDLIVLARYMQILSPEFVFRYEGKIINIHPSLLPAFPGPRSYHQAYNKGVEIAGVTAHFVTTDLDEGPIICQESFRIDKGRDAVENLIEKGRQLEAKALTRAVKLFLDDRLCLRRGKVIDSKKENLLSEKTRKFYAERS